MCIDWFACGRRDLGSNHKITVCDSDRTWGRDIHGECCVETGKVKQQKGCTATSFSPYTRDIHTTGTGHRSASKVSLC